MYRLLSLGVSFAGAFCLFSGAAIAGDASRTDGVAQGSQVQLLAQMGTGRDDDRIYGRDLMTDEERTEYRERMRSAGSAEERERLRREHHERMSARARERGVELPEEPPAGRGPGMGRGMGGPGGGMGGPGGGMGGSGGGRGGGR
jgi:hypothetical protein